MDTAFLQQSLLVQHFRMFYQELVRLKGHALSTTLLKNSKPSEKNLCRYIFNKLVELLSENRNAAVGQGDKATTALYDEALYIMVALADEAFLTLRWPGNQAWTEHLLEVHFFNTHRAGEHFFEKLDAFLSQNNKVHKDLGVLYLWCLGLNFLGKHDAPESVSSLETYKKRLFSLIYHGSTNAVAAEEPTLLSPEAYKHILRGSRPSHLPSLQFWYRCLYGTFGFMLLFSSFLWYHDMTEIRTILNMTEVMEVSL